MTTITKKGKKKKVSKKNKIAWRKHTDIKDVDKFLEDKRLEERLGKPFAEREDDELFQIDTKPVSNKNEETKIRKISYEPKCFNMLKSHSEVPDPISKRNHVKPPGTKSHPLVAKKRLEKEIKKSMNLLNKQKKRKTKNEIPFETKEDIWNVEDVHIVEKDMWLEKDTVRHTLTNLGKLKKHTPVSIQKKPTILPTIEIPRGGMSYNPSLEDHQNLLKEIADKEETLIKRDQHLNRVTTKMFKRMSAVQKEANTFAELIEGLPIETKKNNKGKKKKTNENLSESDGEYGAINAPVVNKKKDTKQRRKQREQKLLERQRQLKKMEKKKIHDILNVTKLKEDLQSHDKKCEILKEKREKKAKYAELEPKRLAATKFENPDLEFNLGQDIAGNLRNVKPEGSLLFDRFKSLQKRNILEPSKIRMKKKRKVKPYVKSDHKIDF